jgi:hypothetical protein
MFTLLEPTERATQGFTFFEVSNFPSAPTAEFKAPNLKRIIKLAEARDLEVEQLKQQPEGTPDLKRKELYFKLWALRSESLAYVATIMCMGKNTKIITKGMFPLMYEQFKNTPWQELMDLVMKERQLPMYLRAGLEILEQCELTNNLMCSSLLNQRIM